MSIQDLTIVITTFKSENAVSECLKHIDKDCKVINIENSNNQDYKKKIEQSFKNVHCILTGENLGYAKANNIGLKNTSTKYALILNPDTNLLPDTLEKFFIAAKRLPDFAIIGPIINTNENISDENNNDTKQVDKVRGHAMFLNLSEFREIGFFDENFFIYLEEIDLCKRLIEKGKKIYIDKNIKISHKGGSSHDKSINFEMELSRNWHWMWSTFYFNRKYKGFIFALLLIIPKLISSILKFLFFTTIQKQKKKQIYLQRFSGLINSILGKRSWYRPKI